MGAVQEMRPEWQPLWDKYVDKYNSLLAATEGKSVLSYLYSRSVSMLHIQNTLIVHT